jgi:DNA-binding NarL/FixJ family response regulator
MTGSPATILVIEKHPLMRSAIINAIADEPDLTIGAVAANGQDTLQIVETLHPKIILFAIGNPGEEELETMRELHERSPDAVFLALTTNEVPGQEEAALKHGADAVLAKTAPRAELLHTLRVMKANVEREEENDSDSPENDSNSQRSEKAQSLPEINPSRLGSNRSQ